MFQDVDHAGHVLPTPQTSKERRPKLRPAEGASTETDTSSLAFPSCSSFRDAVFYDPPIVCGLNEQRCRKLMFVLNGAVLQAAAITGVATPRGASLFFLQRVLSNASSRVGTRRGVPPNPWRSRLCFGEPRRVRRTDLSCETRAGTGQAVWLRELRCRNASSASTSPWNTF